MITVAFDAATERCTVAASDGARTARHHVDGPRRHAGAILGLIEASLREVEAGPGDVRRVLTGDGPGSFTGLRVAAAVAKAMVWRRDVEWRVAPSLLVRAFAHAPAGGGTVIAVSDALRGEVYAGCWRIDRDAMELVGPPPRAIRPEQLATFGAVDVVVGSIPDALVAAVTAATGRTPITGDAALPDADALLALARVPGGTVGIDHAATWEPDYGRPAEAQAVWERAHGRPLPVAPGITR